MTILSPCSVQIDPESECTIERSIELALMTCWDGEPPTFLTRIPDDKSPCYPYVKTQLLDPGEGQKSCSAYRFQTVVRFRVYAKSDGVAIAVADCINRILKANPSGKSKIGNYCILKPGMPYPTSLPDGVTLVQLSVPVAIYAQGDE